jgi:alpha-1,3-glucan synthase
MDGDPSNNDYYKLVHEYDQRETQMRTGGDAKGLMSARGLDYLQSMGYQAIYVAGTNFLNMPWQADGEFSSHYFLITSLFPS